MTASVDLEDRAYVKRSLTQDDLVFLKELQHELNNQPTLATADPRFFVIRDYAYREATDGDDIEAVELSASQIAEKMTSTVDSEFDPVTKPSHYAGHTGIECKQAMESMPGTDEYVSYMHGCAFKYLWRWKSKNGIEDLKKAHECIENMLEALEGCAL